MARRSLPGLPGLRAFEAFARAGSMTAAADELCVTHGAISRHIRNLETQLGAQLVVGPRHNLALTEAGRTLAAALTASLDAIAAALPGAGAEEELVVSCYATFAMKWLIPRLPAFLSANPGVHVRILESHEPVEFGEAGVHAAIRIEGAGRPDGSRAVAFMHHYHGPVLAPGLLTEAGDDRRRLFHLPRLHSETFCSAWTEWAERSGVTLPPSPVDRLFEHNSYMLEAAAAGMGVAVAPWAFSAADIERGRLVAPFGFEPVERRYVYLRPRLGEHPAATRFGEWLREEGRRAGAPPAPLRSAGA
jgi:DNA-binding transcriptional LysR family regulator